MMKKRKDIKKESAIARQFQRSPNFESDVMEKVRSIEAEVDSIYDGIYHIDQDISTSIVRLKELGEKKWLKSRGF